MTDADLILEAIQPVILLLAFGVVAVVLSRALRLSPVVGYLLLGLVLGGMKNSLLDDGYTVRTLAELGVVFLLFDVGLHFSFSHLRQQARDIFLFGPLQVVLGALGMGAITLLFGLSGGAALLVGATLALSSTAVVARLIAERHQQGCPVGMTATAILIFQDIAAIFILIISTALESGHTLLPAIGLALAKATASFAVAILLARIVVRPAFDLISRTRNEEIITAMALLVALAAGWATGSIGLSLTLGAFLGGVILSDTPYRVVIQSEIKPFRGLLLSFFFISVGLSIDVGTVVRLWPAVLCVAALIVLAKIVLNAGASLAFRWSIPGSTQLAFLLAQGSEFTFVIFSVPAVRILLGPDAIAVLVPAVALTLAMTPTLAEIGRASAGRLRMRRPKVNDLELIPQSITAPVLIVCMGRRGRSVADGLIEFGFDYAAVDADDRRVREAIADGYKVMFGDISDPRIWGPVSVEGRKLNVLTEAEFDVFAQFVPVAARRYPGLLLMTALDEEPDVVRFDELGLRSVVDHAGDGIDLAVAVLVELGVDVEAVGGWAHRRRVQSRMRPMGAIAA